MASDATTKSHPPDIDIMALQTSAGVAKGSSGRMSRRQGDKAKPRDTS